MIVVEREPMWRPADGYSEPKREPVSLWPDAFIAAEMAKLPYEDRFYTQAHAELEAKQTEGRLRRNAEMARERRRDEANHTCQCSHCTDPF